MHKPDWAYLRAGTGEAGRKMLQARHRLRVDESSMIGWSIVHRQARIALDVGTDAVRFDNPALPNTRSEMALPLISRGNIIGAVTIQSTKPAAFTSEDITVLQTMADQITTAAENARLFERTQTALNDTRAAQSLLSTLIDNIPYPIFYKDTHGAYLGCNRAYEQYVGRNRQEFMGKTVAAVYTDPVVIEKHQTLDQALFDQPGTQVYEMQVTYADGIQHAVIFNKATFTDTAGRLAGLVGTMIDITERKHAEMVLRDSEAQLSEALHIAQLGYWEYDVEKDLFLFNDQFYSIFHTTAEAEGGYEIPSAVYARKFVHPDDAPLVGQEIGQALNSTGPSYSRELEHRILYADSGVGHISVRLYVDRDEDGHIRRVYGANQDITERKLSELRLAEAIRLAKMGYWTYDVPTDTFTFNDQFYALMRTTAEQEGGYTMSSAQYTQRFVHPDDAPLVGIEIVKALETTDPDYRGEVDHRVYFADGELGYITVRFTVEKDAEGRTIRTQGANQDITERKLTEETIQQEQRRIQTILRTISVPMIISRLSDSTVLYANEALAEFRHMNLSELIGSRTTNYFANPADQLKIRDLLRHEGYVVDFETQLMGSSEEPAWVLLSARVIDFQNEASVLSTYVDITERKRAEEALRRNEAELSEALRTAQMANWSYDVPTDTFTFNDQFYALMRTTAEQESGYTMSSAQYTQRFVHPDDAALVGAEIGKALETPDPNYHGQVDHRVYFADGEPGYITVRFTIEKDAEGRTIRTQGANENITERKVAELERERLLRDVERRANQVEAVAEVGAVSATILEPHPLLENVVQLTRRRFNLYHCHIFLLDEAGQALAVRACGWREDDEHYGTTGERVIQPDAPQSLVARAARSRQPVIVNDVRSEPGWLPNPLLPDIQSEMALPMIVGNDVLGVFNVHSEERDHFTADDARAMFTLATQVAIALQNARLFEQTRQSAQNMTNLNEVMRAISQEIELEWLLESTYQNVQHLLPVDIFSVALYDPATDSVSYPLVYAEGESHTEPAHPIEPESPLGRVIRTGEPILENVSQAEWLAALASVADTPGHVARPAASQLFVPLRHGNQTIGVLSVQTYQFDAYTRQHVGLLENVASQLAVAIRNAQLLEQTRQAVDELNTLNRRLTGEAWQSYVQSARAGKRHLACQQSDAKPDESRAG